LTEEPTGPTAPTSRAVFISYASEDIVAAERLCTALRARGVEVWFDQSSLRGGDAWDESIRTQIRTCALFVPVISANAHARVEGYFRFEWKLAIDRSHLIASDQSFLLPVVIDATGQTDQRIPERFREIHWSRAPDGEPSPALVDHVARMLSSEPSHEVARTSPVGHSLQRDVSESTKRNSYTKGLLAAATIVALLAAIYVGVQMITQSRRAVNVPADVPAAETNVKSSGRSSALKPRIAVLPFDNLSPDPSNAFFTDGVHEEILTTLANRASGLEVISRTTMNSYKGRSVAVQTLARELDCNYILEGSVRREGREIRLTLQLIDARNDSHLWAQDYDRKLENTMALESEIAAAVAAQLSLRFADTLPAATSTSNPLAYDLYLKARATEANARQDDSVEGYHSAERLLDRAIEIDPNFVRARLQRMALHLRLFLYNYASADDMLALAHRDLDATRRLAPSDPTVTGWSAVLAFAEMNYASALELFDSAEAAGLADPELLDWKHILLYSMGKYPAAVALSQRLADLDPKNEDAQVRWWYMLISMHEYREALALADTGIIRGQAAEAWKVNRATVLFYGGGNLEPRKASFAPTLTEPWRTAQDLQDNISNAFFELFLEHRFKDLRTLIDQVPQVEDWNCRYIDWTVYRIGLTPVADTRGWADLLLGDREATRHDGQRILDYLQRHPDTKWSRWFHLMLRADAQLFLGDGRAANRTAAEAVALTRLTPDVSDQMNAYVWSTHILAWTDAKQDAVKRLVELSTSVPGLWPGEITGNPIFSMPLAQLDGYKELSERLSAQMRGLQLK
jgi:TolB-like protein